MLRNDTITFLPFLFTNTTYFKGQPRSLVKCYVQKSHILNCNWPLREACNIQSRPSNHNTSVVSFPEMNDGSVACEELCFSNQDVLAQGSDGDSFSYPGCSMVPCYHVLQANIQHSGRGINLDCCDFCQ